MGRNNNNKLSVVTINIYHHHHHHHRREVQRGLNNTMILRTSTVKCENVKREEYV